MSNGEETRPAVRCVTLGTVPGVVRFLRVLDNSDVDPSHSRQVSCGAVLSDGRVVTGSDDFVLRLRNADGSVGKTLNCQEFVICVARSGQVVAAGIAGGRVAVFDTTTGARTAYYVADTHSVSALAFVSGTSSLLVTVGADDRQAKLWCLAGRNPRLVASFEGLVEKATSCAVSSRGEWLAACNSTQTLVWAIPRRAVDAPCRCSPVISLDLPARLVRFAPLGDRLQLWSSQALRLWDIPTNAVVEEVPLAADRPGKLMSAAVDGPFAVCAVQHDGDSATTLYRCLLPLAVAQDVTVARAAVRKEAAENLLNVFRDSIVPVQAALSEKRGAQKSLAETIQRDRADIDGLSMQERENRLKLTKAEEKLAEMSQNLGEDQARYDRLVKTMSGMPNAETVLSTFRQTSNLDTAAALKMKIEKKKRLCLDISGCIRSYADRTASNVLDLNNLGQETGELCTRLVQLQAQGKILADLAALASASLQCQRAEVAHVEAIATSAVVEELELSADDWAALLITVGCPSVADWVLRNGASGDLTLCVACISQELGSAAALAVGYVVEAVRAGRGRALVASLTPVSMGPEDVEARLERLPEPLRGVLCRRQMTGLELLFLTQEQLEAIRLEEATPIPWGQVGAAMRLVRQLRANFDASLS
eukprot:m51a1_g9283 hypothetical protein (650) ;mRNA; f:139-2311